MSSLIHQYYGDLAEADVLVTLYSNPTTCKVLLNNKEVTLPPTVIGIKQIHDFADGMKEFFNALRITAKSNETITPPDINAFPKPFQVGATTALKIYKET